jgi:imidazolonepropionase-like amidohydrolase
MKKTVSHWSLACVLGLVGITCSALAQQTSSTKPEVGILEHRNEVFAIQNATVVTEPGKKLDKATIVIRDGKIAEIGTSVTPPPEARIIDLAGKTIYPGFVDAGIDMEVTAAETPKGTPHWNSEITPDRSIADVVIANEAMMSKLRKAGITTALVAPRDGIIKGTSAVMLTSNQPPMDALLRSEVALHVRLTTTRGRGRDSYPGSPMGAVALARQTFLDAQWHALAWHTYRSQTGIEKPESNSAFDAMNAHLTAGKMVMFDALNEQYALRADAFGREFGLNVVLKGSGQEYQLLDKIAKTHRTIIVPVNFPKPPNVSTAEAALDAELEELTHWELAPENPSRLAKAGVKFAITSSGLTDASELVPQIRKAIARGLDKNLALEAITTIPAAILGVDNECGAIKPGAWANLVIASGDLWDDKTKIDEVWVRGERPNAAYKIETNADGKWQVTLTPGTAAIENRPQQLLLTLTDTTKKISGVLALPEAAAASQEKKSEPDKAESKESPSDATPNKPNSDKPTPDQASSDKPTADKPATIEPPATAMPADAPADAPVPADEQSAKKEEASEEKNTDKPKDEKGRGDRGDKGKKADEKGKAKLKNPKWEDRTLTATFPAGSLIEGQSGVGYLTLALLPSTAPESADGILVGTIQWPDGKQQLVSATKASPDKANADKANADKKDEGTKEDSKEGKGDKGKEGKDDKKGPKPILSPVLYPVGVQGRNGLPEQPEYVVFQNTTLWTCGPDGLLKDADLIVHRGLIEKIGVDLPVPNGATVIDASKLQLSPGLIDCHSHMASDSGINEATQAVTAEVRIGDFIDASDITIYRQLAGGLTAANVLHGSANPIGGQNQVIKLRWGGTYDDLKFADAPAGIKFALGENVKQSNVQETTRSRYPQSRMGVEQLFRDRFNSALQYDAAWKKWNKERVGLPPRRDLELDAIAEILRGERWIHCHSYRQDEILGLLRVLEEYNIKIGSLQHILEGYKVAEAMAKHGATASTFSDWWNYKLEVLDAIPYNGAIMHQQGIIVSFNSDDAELGRHMNHEAAKAVKYGGVEPMEALKFVTLNPAKQLRIDAKVGSLEVGKHADISIWNGSPLSPMARCEQTWIDGRKYFDRVWDEETRKRDFDLHQGLVQKILDSGEAAGDRSPLADDPSRLWPHHDEFCHHDHSDDDGAQEHGDHGHGDHEHGHE